MSHNFPVFFESHTLMRSTAVCRLRALFHGSDFMTNDSVPLVSRTAIARNDHNGDQGCLRRVAVRLGGLANRVHYEGQNLSGFALNREVK